MLDRRLTWLAAIVLFWGAAVFLKLVSLQVLHHQQYLETARSRQEMVIELPAPRGTIFDRTGHPLAMSVPAESVYLNPLKVPDLDMAADLLARPLHLDRNELFGSLKAAYDSHRGFLWVKRKVDFEEAQTLRGMHIEWIAFRKETLRHYPNGSLAAHVVGSVDFEEKGNAGLEKFLDPQLRGQPGQLRLLTDVKRRGIDEEPESEAHPGISVTTTIDERIQFVAEREIAAAVRQHNAASGSVVVMNPSNGDILALASYPTYDPNLPPEPGQNFARMNHAVSVPFEPGSVYKIITLSAALETTRLRPESLIDCHGGVLKLPGRVIHDSHLGYGIMPMEMVLAKSSNIGAIEIGLKVGQEKMYDYMRRFGFGQKSGLPLPAESAGKVRKLKYWGTTSLASVSMGQEVSVTTVQLAQAVSVIANGGFLIRPRLLLKRGGETMPPAAPVRVLKPDTAFTMRQMMEGVVLNGTGTKARLTGYSTAGKTGTAQVYDFATRHYTHSYNGSFVGFAPINRPAIVVVVTLNGTRGTTGFGGAASAPVFHAVATEALRVMEVPKDLPDELPKTLVAGKEDVNDLAAADTETGETNILEEGDDEEASAPAAIGPVAPAVVLQAALPKVPDFKGKTMRAVLAEAAARGLLIQPNGSGVARMQTPPAGSVLREGERIRVHFEP